MHADRQTELRNIIIFYLRYRFLITRQIAYQNQTGKHEPIIANKLYPPIPYYTASIIMTKINAIIALYDYETQNIINMRFAQNKTLDALSGLLDMSRSRCYEKLQYIIDDILLKILMTPSDARDILLSQNIYDYQIHEM